MKNRYEESWENLISLVYLPIVSYPILADYKIVKEAVYKQVPSKVKVNGSYEAYCPNCSNRIRIKGKYKSEYCDKCGQALDWRYFKW